LEIMQSSHHLTFRRADLSHPGDADATLQLLNHYAADAMGLGRELTPEVRRQVISGLRGHPSTLVFLARAKEEPIALAVCFHGFSTFNARPLLNIHDFVVRRDYRAQGVGTRLLEFVAKHAEEMGCCRLTLEVRADNAPAKSVYSALGFDSGSPSYEFWTKPLGGE
jgi:ribosomal protein S18 acetylase RimI-like enzyme